MTLPTDSPASASPEISSKSQNGKRKPHWVLLTTTVVLAILLAVAVLWNLGAFKPTPRIAIITSGDGPYWDAVIAGAQEAAKVYDVELTVVRSKTDVDVQNKSIRSLLGEGYAGMAICPINPGTQANLLGEVANESTLVCFDSDSPISRRLCFVGTDNYAAGRTTAENVRDAIPEGGEVIICVGNFDKQNTQRRRQGVIDELLDRSFEPDRPADPIAESLKADKYTIVTTLVDGSDPAKAVELASAALVDHPDVKCFVGMLSYSAPAVLTALDKAGKTGKVKVVGFDCDDRTLAAIENGSVYATMMQDQFGCGFHAVRILADDAHGIRAGLPMFQVHYLSCTPIKQANLKQAQATLGKTKTAKTPT